MAEKFRSLIRVIANEINKYRLFNNATLTINNVTERAQEKLSNIQNVVASKYDVVAKQVSKDMMIIQNLNAAKLEPSPLPKKVVKWMQWYQQLTGLDSVELAKHQVISAQDKLFKCQDERRKLNRQATIINDKLKEVYSELIQTKRDDPKYVQLTIIENKSLQEHTRIVSQLNLLENDEKDHFTQLATAIKEYHDSQTMNAQKYKYLSILASAILAIVSLAGSMIYNNKRIANVRNVIAEAQRSNESALQSNFQSLERNMNAWISQLVENRNNTKQDTNLAIDESDKILSNHISQGYVILGLCIVGVYIIRAITG
ncbi:uncharacterized protein LOC122395670 [Colletes gigas]|uniref:uncharacterized protein LOC122395670 n=1 Tax=Colletes gigas TaxID=935657 RepID=UPI001C9A76D5|nr:uncharacterized protein LOC122395670 [Colletes gigas]